MPRGTWKKRWIKLYVTGWLHGSIRWQFTSEERGVWADLLAWAGEIQKEGKICDNDGRSLPRDFMANALNIKQILLDRVIAKSIHEGRLKDDDGVLVLTNYETYQSEYERQKPFRAKKPEPEPKPASDLEQFIEEMRPQYPGLDMDNEVKKFHLYWSEGNRKLKRPKLALKNWLDKARTIQAGNSNTKLDTVKEQPEPETLFDEDGKSYYIDSQGLKVY